MSGAERRAGVFDAYSRYYDLLYRDKDYAVEAAQVAAMLREQRPGLGSLLDLGCGTARHAAELVALGFEVTGVERSASMLAAAMATRERLAPALRGRLQLVPGDAREVRLRRRYDAVTALFHVASYQTDDASLRAFFDTAAAHLEPGGLFLFDYWYGPAVLSQQPEARVRRIADAEIEVERHATPVLHAERNVVDVNYRIVVRELTSGRSEELHETHSMRYLFSPELDAYLEASGFDMLLRCEFGSRAQLSLTTWNAVCVARLRQA